MSKHPKPAVIAFGRAGQKAPRAVWFCAADTAVAQWVATQYDLTLLPATPDLLKSLEVAIEPWEIGADGHPVIPVTTMRAFTRLEALATQARAGDPAGVLAGSQAFTPAASPAATPETEQARTLLWGAINIGSLVLAPAQDPAEGWWEATVLAVTNDACILAWRDFPDEGLIRRKRQQLALLPSAP